MRKIRFDKNEFVGGGVDFPTLCPYGVVGKYTKEIIGVGSRACFLCNHFGGIIEDSVKCKFEKNVSVLPKKQKGLFFK